MALPNAPALAQSGPPADADATAAMPKAAASAPQAATQPEANPKGARNAAQLQRVEIIGVATDTDLRRASTASRIVIGREEIERFGDSSVSEVLKRLPGVTTGGRPGRGGDVRMRGMGGGYTQILVNGERMPPGFSLDDLPPDQVERIEVMRAPTAEYGARAIAGTINIVLKEALKKTLNELRLGMGVEQDRVSPNASWTHNDKFGEKVAYTLTLSVNQSKRRDDADTRTRWYDLQSGNIVLDQHETGFTDGTREGLHLNGRVQMALAEGESLILTPFMVLSQGNYNGHSVLDQAAGGAIAPPYASALNDGDNRFGMLRANAQWQKKLSDATRIEVRGGLGQGHFQSHSLRHEFDQAGQPTRNTDDRSNTEEDNWTLNSKLWHQLESEHSLVGGLELDSSERHQDRITRQDGLPLLTEFGDDLNASSKRMAVYLQDEWNPSKQVSAYAGLRWEGIRTRSESDIYQVGNQSSVLTPLLHGVWKPDEASRDQWRSSLTRSYKAATLQDLIARPSLSQRFPNGANEVGSPDRAGNPKLKPELASGFELAYEHYLGKGGLMSANVFYRRISDLMRNVVALEDVSWSTVQRWVSRPQNVGNASAQGLELEAKFRLDELMDDAIPIAVRANLSFFNSRVDQVSGPNNRLEGQPRGTANLGADYKFRTLPISLGASVNITPGYEVQLSDIQNNSVGTKVVTDAFVLWFINPGAQLRFSANNMLPRDYLSTSSLLNASQNQVNESANPSNINWSVRLELKL
jgi:outer membrane receptor for ferrienterochelin and colicins